MVKEPAGKTSRTDWLIAAKLRVTARRREGDWVGGYTVVNHDQVIV